MIGPILVALALITAASAAALFYYSGRRERSEDVMMRLRAGDDATVLAATKTDQAIDNAYVRWGCHLLWRSGYDVEPATVVTLTAVAIALAGLCIMIGGWIGGSLVVALVTLLVSAVLGAMAARRRGKIVEQLPQFLEAVIRVLAAGNTLEEAMGSAAKEATEPSRSLFLSVSRQVRLGAPIDLVLTNAADVYQIKDLRVIALAANINRRYGGTLRNVSRSLIQAIRMREAAARELRALTAETRFSAMVLAFIPMAVSTFIYVRNRAFYDDMLTTTSGKVILASALILQVLGVIVIWRMMRSTRDGA